MRSDVQILNNPGTNAKPGTAAALPSGTASQPPPTPGRSNPLKTQAASPKAPLPEVPTITIYLDKNSTRIEINDAALPIPAVRLQRAFRQANKELHVRRLQKTRQQQAKTQS